MKSSLIYIYLGIRDVRTNIQSSFSTTPKPNIKNIMTKEIFVLSGEIKTPPFSSEVRREAGFLLRKIQEGESLSMPYSRPMPSIGKSCHELRLGNGEENWRIVYRVDSDTILILEIFNKKTQKTPKQVIDNCQRRIKRYDEALH